MKCLALLQARLMPDHSGSANVLDFATRIGNDPVPRNQLHSVIASVFDLDMIGVKPQSATGV